MSSQIVLPWLQSFAQTAVDQNLEAHMAHISKEVSVKGYPGFDEIRYDDWQRQCAEEFPQGLIKGLSYIKPKVNPDSNNERVSFVVLETILTSDGGSKSLPLEMFLQNIDSKWLLVELRVLPQDEAEQAGLN